MSEEYVSHQFDLYERLPNGQPPFESVYDNIYGFGRTKSVSYRLWRANRDSTSLHKLVGRRERKQFRRAVSVARSYAILLKVNKWKKTS